MNRFKMTLRRIFKTLSFPDVSLIDIFARVVVVVSTSLCDATGDTHMHTCYAIVYFSLFVNIWANICFSVLFLVFKNLN